LPSTSPSNVDTSAVVVYPSANRNGTLTCRRRVAGATVASLASANGRLMVDLAGMASAMSSP
jgi:hypothetical protein